MTDDSTRAARLAEALRANLRRRKDQARERAGPPPDAAPPPDPGRDATATPGDEAGG